MRAGILKYPIEVYKFTKEPNEYGEYVTIKTKVYSTRANIIQNGGSRTESNSEITYPYNKIFETRIYVPITEDDHILFKDKYYRVLSIEDNDFNQNKTITTVLVNE